MKHDEAWVKARAERDVLLGELLRAAGEQAKALHKALGLSSDMLVVVDETGVHLKPKDADSASVSDVDAATRL